MNEKTKLELFEQMLAFVHKSDEFTKDWERYYDQACGAYAMLKILGLGSEYLKWEEEKYDPWFGCKHYNFSEGK